MERQRAQCPVCSGVGHDSDAHLDALCAAREWALLVLAGAAVESAIAYHAGALSALDRERLLPALSEKLALTARARAYWASETRRILMGGSA